MSNGPEFFRTMMGRKFYEADVPNLIEQMKRMADSLDRATKVKALEPSQPHEPVGRTEYVVGLEERVKVLESALAAISLMEYESTSSASEKVHAAARKARFALHGEEKP